jgi:beta-lactamase regulating signal transducer with metallopeptidase domain
MSDFQRLSEAWLSWVVAASWQVALLACLVGTICWLARGGSPRLRHALWLLVLIKAFLPPGMTAPWSVGRWIPPTLAAIGVSEGNLLVDSNLMSGDNAFASIDSEPQVTARVGFSAPTLLLVWASGCLLFAVLVAWRYARLVRAIRALPPIDEGPLRVALERVAMQLHLAQVPELYSASLVTSPFLFGVLRPSIVLPERSLSELDDNELEGVLAHELVHYQRCDAWIGWLQVLAQGLFWFHPLMWWANRQLRHEREAACDETVLRLGNVSAERYGESLVHVLTASRGRSLAAGSLVGVLERSTNLCARLENIMNFQLTNERYGFGSRLLVLAVAVTFLPMGPRPAGALAATAAAPKIVKTSPAVGATDVDPKLGEISVTFDQDMSKGMSWTGSPPEFPPLDASRQPGWRDARTCALPVKLEAGAMYRLGINSSMHLNFKSAAGIPAAPSVLYFTTVGATGEQEKQLRAPMVVSLNPPNGAIDVDPKKDTLQVTFDMPMGAGMSWTGGGPTFPKLAEGKKPSWSADGLTCTLPVMLEPGKEYQLGLNSASHKNFQNKAGVPLTPVVYKFRTANAK